MKTKDLPAASGPLDPAAGIVPTAPAAPEHPAPPPSSTSPSTTRRPAKQGLYDRIGMTLALGLGLAVAFLLWLAGAYFTLQFLSGMGVMLAGAGPAQWLIPAAITAAELWLWPRAATRPQQTALFLGVLAFDVGTSLIGLFNWAAGRLIPGVGTLPAGGWPLWAGAAIVALVCAFWPEKLGKWSVSELRKVWL